MRVMRWLLPNRSGRMAAVLLSCGAALFAGGHLPAKATAVAAEAGDLAATGAEESVVREMKERERVRVLFGTGEYAEGVVAAKSYLNDRNYRNVAGWIEVMEHLARMLDENGDVDGAIQAYSQLWSREMGRVSVSAPAIKRWMELAWQRNKPADGRVMSDRQGAYNGGAQYLEATSTPAFQRWMTPEERERRDQVAALVATYGAEPGIVTLEEWRMKEKNLRGWSFGINPWWAAVIWAAGIGVIGFAIRLGWGCGSRKKAREHLPAGSE